MSRRTKNSIASRLAVGLVGLCLAIPACCATLSFGLFGDVYMTPEHQGYLKGMLDDMAQKNEALAIFTGGIKPTEQGCDDRNLLVSYPVFAKAPLPTVYVPGDADWAACAKFSPEERLNLLRKTFYQGDRSLGEPSIPLIRQTQYPELMRWQTGPAVFVTLNVTGDNNHWGQKSAASAEYQSRNAASLDWLRDAFQVARDSTSGASMLVIVMHGDPEFDNPGVSESPTGYRPLLDLLKAETEAFPGQVLLVHGGSGVHRIDHPLLNASNLPYQNFTRVGTYGALQQGWVQVRVKKNDKAGDDPVKRMEFHFESFPWPPLSHDESEAADDGASSAPGSTPAQ